MDDEFFDGFQRQKAMTLHNQSVKADNIDEVDLLRGLIDEDDNAVDARKIIRVMFLVMVATACLILSYFLIFDRKSGGEILTGLLSWI